MCYGDLLWTVFSLIRRLSSTYMMDMILTQYKNLVLPKVFSQRWYQRPVLSVVKDRIMHNKMEVFKQCVYQLKRQDRVLLARPSGWRRVWVAERVRSLRGRPGKQDGRGLSMWSPRAVQFSSSETQNFLSNVFIQWYIGFGSKF